MELSSRAIARRVKTYLRSNELEIFVPVLPGLEPVAAREIETLGYAATAEHGGVVLTADLMAVYRTNLTHRTGNRVLIRLADFLAQSYPMLYNRTRKLPWEILLGNCRGFEVHVTYSKSRLRNKSHIEKVVLDAISEHCRILGVLPRFDSDCSATVHVRLQRDRCTISLDTSGDHLHKRGYRPTSTLAPIRETIAAGILLIAGAATYDVVVDPFCGSGTICIEADMIARNAPPGYNREFAIERTPLHSPGKYAEARRKAMAQVRHHAGVRIKGFDISADSIATARDCAARACTELVQFNVRDALSLRLDTLKANSERGLLVSNVPYGVRLGTSSSMRELLTAFTRRLIATGSSWDFALITATPDVFFDPAIQVSQRLRFQNGGLTVEALFGTIS